MALNDKYKPSTAEEHLSRMMVRELEKYGRAKDLYSENASNQEKLEALVSEYRKQLGVPKERFPTTYSENVGALGQTEKDQRILGPTIMGGIKILGKKPEGDISQKDYEQYLSSYIHELRHAKEFMSDTELLKNLEKEHKHFKNAPAGEADYSKAQIADEGDLWAILEAEKEAKKAEKEAEEAKKLKRIIP